MRYKTVLSVSHKNKTEQPESTNLDQPIKALNCIQHSYSNKVKVTAKMMIVKEVKSTIYLPRKKCATVTFVLPSATNLTVSLPIRLNSILLWTFLTLPLLLPMFSTIMLLYSGQISEGPCWIVVNASFYGAQVHFFLDLFACSLL